MHSTRVLARLSTTPRFLSIIKMGKVTKGTKVPAKSAPKAKSASPKEKSPAKAAKVEACDNEGSIEHCKS